MKNLIIIGAGGYAKSVIDSLDHLNFRLVGFIDDIKPIGGNHQGYPILFNDIIQVENPQDFVYFVAIGHNGKRKRWYDRLKTQGLSLINVIDRTALISPHAELGEGNFIGKLSILNHGSKVGNNCVINTRALIEHGCVIEDHVNVSTNATLNGDVIAKVGSFIGSGTVINGQITIGEWALVGSGAVVIKDVIQRSSVVGIPAREIKSNSKKYNTL